MNDSFTVLIQKHLRSYNGWGSSYDIIASKQDQAILRNWSVGHSPGLKWLLLSYGTGFIVIIFILPVVVEIFVHYFVSHQ